MKTSNKLLIALALVLILIPVLGMVYVSATAYKTGANDRVDVVPKVEKFNIPSESMTGVAMPQAFKSVNIENGLGLDFNIQLIKDEQSGVKISNEYKDLIAAIVDKDGILQLNVKAPKTDGNQRRNYHAIIYIYSPRFNSLSVANAKALAVKANTDVLNLNFSKIETFYFNNGTSIKDLNFKASEVKDLTLRRDSIKSVHAVVTNTKFTIEDMSLELVDISTNGNSSVDVSRTDNNLPMQSIKNLILNTNGIADVKIENIKVNNCSGKFSDDTQVQMPAIFLNQMYKK